MSSSWEYLAPKFLVSSNKKQINKNNNKKWNCLTLCGPISWSIGCTWSITCCCCCSVASVVYDSVRPHGQQPIRLPHPWDSPGKNTGVGCHFLLQCMKVKSESKVAQSCLTLSDPMDYSLPRSSIHGFSRQEYWSGVPLPSPGVSLGDSQMQGTVHCCL